MEKKMKYGDRIKILRKELRITQKKMAEKLEISQAYLSDIENGKMEANAKTLFGLSKNFGVRMLWLMDGIGEIFVPSFGDFRMTVYEKKNDNNCSFINNMSSFIEEGKFMVFKLDDDNMEPFFLAGDEILVDVEARGMEDRGVYLFEIGSKMVLKRFVVGSVMKLTNDKPVKKNNDIIFNSSMKCIGRAAWIIRKI
jgi:transcriptional regulator with XRE-family HTH domain